MTKRQFIAAMAVASAFVAAIAVALFLFFGQQPEENNVVGTEELNAQDIRDLEILSSTFLQEAGTFGINMDTLTDATVSQRMQDIANDNGGTSWIKRGEVASRVTNEYVDLSGGFPFDLSRISNADYTDGNRVASFRAGPMDLTVNSTADYVFTNRDEPALVAKVGFKGTSTLAHFSQSQAALDPSKLENHDVESTPWDISEQTVLVDGTLSLVKDDSPAGWKVRGISFSSGEFALPFWSPDQYTTSYPNTELGGTVVRTVNFPSSEEPFNG